MKFHTGNVAAPCCADWKFWLSLENTGPKNCPSKLKNLIIYSVGKILVNIIIYGKDIFAYLHSDFLCYYILHWWILIFLSSKCKQRTCFPLISEYPETNYQNNNQVINEFCYLLLMAIDHDKLHVNFIANPIKKKCLWLLILPRRCRHAVRGYSKTVVVQ